MKGHGLVQYYFHWTAQRYYNQALAFTNKLCVRLAHCALCVLSVNQAFC